MVNVNKKILDDAIDKMRQSVKSEDEVVLFVPTLEGKQEYTEKEVETEARDSQSPLGGKLRSAIEMMRLLGLR